MKLSKQALIALGITGAGVLGCVHTELEGALTREQLDKMLEETAKKKVKKTEPIFACCYIPCCPPGRIDYICPFCKTKTHHAERENIKYVEDVDWYRQEMKCIKELNLDAALDETDLCSQCRRDKDTNATNLYILVWVDKQVVRTPLKKHDLTKIIAFLEKKDVWVGECDATYPLKDELPRIRAILGLEEDGKQGVPQQKN